MITDYLFYKIPRYTTTRNTFAYMFSCRLPKCQKIIHTIHKEHESFFVATEPFLVNRDKIKQVSVLFFFHLIIYYF